MGKAATPRALPETEAKAVARMLRVSPQKLNLVAQLIRGKKVATALADLEFSRKRISPTPRTTTISMSTISWSARPSSARRSS
jgi:large subunit ribosomal protein L22